MAALMVLAVSCKKDKPTGNNTLVVDGVSRNIVEASVGRDDMNKGYYNIKLFLSDNSSVQIMLDGKTHLGKTIDLTKNDDPYSPGWYWVFVYFNIGISINADGSASTMSPVFSRGTLFSERLPDKNGNPVLHLELKDGEYDGHTVSMSFNGELVPYDSD